MDHDFFLCTVMVPADKRSVVDKAFSSHDFDDALFAADFIDRTELENKESAKVIGMGIGMAFHRAIEMKKV